jgi:hypothetical protein
MVNHVFLAALVMAVVVLASARLTHIMVQDQIGDGFRRQVIKRFGPHPGSKITYLLTVCHWCNTFWTGGFFSAYALGSAYWILELDWRIAVMSWLPLTLATSYAASRLIDSEES